MKKRLGDKISVRIKSPAAILRENGIFYVAGILAAFGLKYHYSSADAGALRWILTPVERTVGMLSGLNFEWAPGSGYVNHSHGIIIAPACAGVNFLIICFAAIFFTFVSRVKGSVAKCAWFALSIAASCLVMLFANTARIIISIYLYGAPVYGGWVTPERVHQLAGVIIYVGVLVAAFLAAERLARRLEHPGADSQAAGRGRGPRVPVPVAILIVPLVWYAAITVVVPLMNGSVRRYGTGFAEHSIMVLAACVCVFLVSVRVTAHAKKNVDRLNKTKEKG